MDQRFTRGNFGLAVEVELDVSASPPRVLSAGVVRTARKLFDGYAFPSAYLACTSPAVTSR